MQLSFRRRSGLAGSSESAAGLTFMPLLDRSTEALAMADAAGLKDETSRGLAAAELHHASGEVRKRWLASVRTRLAPRSRDKWP